ncbi:MauE/DoxX family redox-associated membrane protein [Serinicoccus hydrothermalis]|uniref:MauE/DoxX family redox-associated membrane protein n=1 Tax=Serinicoccus hydrothermalis TaxID=1758689 RepID=UPI00168A79BA|nr:MauE/DoxX family redox-associated membrane protein [Serinicoccus hydrothermalis]
MSALSLAPVTLAVLLGWSGAAKLREPSATADMVRELRLPRRLAPAAVSRVLPLAELLTALLLLTPWTWTYALGAVAALALCTAFLVVVARAMGFDPRPVCACFGRVGHHEIAGRTVVRNALLVGLAVVAVGIAVAGSSTGRLVADYRWADCVWLALAATAAVVIALVAGGAGRTPDPRADRDAVDDAGRDGGTLLGSVLVDPDLGTTTLLTLVLPRPQVVVVVDCWCGSTFTVLERLPAWRSRAPELGVHLVHTQPPFAEPRAQGLADVWWDPGDRLLTALGTGRGPCAVLVDEGGVLAGPVTGVEEVERLVGYSASRSRTT